MKMLPPRHKNQKLNTEIKSQNLARIYGRRMTSPKHYMTMRTLNMRSGATSGMTNRMKSAMSRVEDTKDSMA